MRCDELGAGVDPQSMLQDCLDRTASLHERLCPRQVLGVRMGLRAGELLQIEVPRRDKRLFTFVETDGCLADGLSAATGCWFGRRTLRLIDHGKVAATFVDTETGRAVRLAPHPAAREAAAKRVPEAPSRWHAQLEGYQTMPTAELLCGGFVEVTAPLATIVSMPGRRAACAECGEEVMNGRDVITDARTVCRACAGEQYWRLLGRGLTLDARTTRRPAVNHHDSRAN
jgi:formylmethanofuran dehydrogenase subunit E